MRFTQENKYFIISAKEYKPALYDFKKRNPFLDVKILTKSDFLDLLRFSYQKDPIPFLLKKGKYDYSQCKKIIDILRIWNLSAFDKDASIFKEYKSIIDEYKYIYEELSKEGYIKQDDLGRRQIENRQILIFEADEDFELHELLNDEKITFEDIHFSDIGREPIYSEKKQPLIYEFNNKFQQFLFIFSDIRKKILENQNHRNNITIFLENEKDLFYINFLSQIFHIDCFSNIELPLSSVKEVSDIVKEFFKQKNFEYTSNISPNSPEEALIKIVKEYDLKSLPFSFAYSSLMEILSSKRISYVFNDKGVSLSNKIFFDSSQKEERLIYVTNFQFGSFYKEFDDNNLLPDDILLNLKVNPSYVKTKLDRRLKMNFILQQKITFLSRVQLHLTDKIYTSQFQKEFGWETKKLESKHNESGVYTSDAKRLLDSYYKDQNHCRPDQEYRTYDHSFSGIDSDFKKDTFYVTEFEEYFKCPFKYYLTKVLKIDKYNNESDKSATRRGDLIHKVFEDIYTRDYSLHFDDVYEKSFQEGIKAYKESAAKDRQPYTISDECSIKLIKHWLKDVVRVALKQKDKEFSNGISSEIHEIPIEYEFISDNQKIKIIGRIDKIIYTKGNQGIQYYTIIDYKSGSSGSFEIHQNYLGGSLQLPLYYLASMDNGEITHNKTDMFGGFGIEHLFFPKKIAVSKGNNIYGEKAIQDNMRLKGITYIDDDYLNSIDKSVFKSTKNGPKLQKNGCYLDCSHTFLDKDSSLLSEDEIKYTMNTYLYDVQNAVRKTVESINQKQFRIAPTKEGQKEACSYCPYSALCYHSKKDIIDIKDEINKRFDSKGSLDESDDEDYGLDEEN